MRSAAEMRMGKQIRLRDKQRGYLSAALKTILIGGGVSPSFDLPLSDAGNGAVNVIPRYAAGSGIATFTRATTAYTTLADGSLYQVGSGVARSCYSAAGVYLGYLAEGARTNLCLQSQTFDHGSWTKGVVTVTADAVVAPDGTTTADKLASSIGTVALHQTYQIGKTLTAIPYTGSVFLKMAEVRWGIVNIYDGANNFCFFDLQNGVVGTAAAGCTTTMQACANGWYFCTATKTTSATANGGLSIEFSSADNSASTVLTTTHGIYAWGAQLEADSFASSYIPTTTAAVTRNAEIDAYVSAGNIGTVGAFVAELTPTNATTRTGYVFGSYTDANNSIALLFDGTNLIARKRVGGTDYDATIAYTMVAGTTVKVGMRWGADGVDVWLNGVKGAGNANATTAVIAATFQIGADGNSANQPFASIKNVKTYPRAPNDGKMASLTT